MGTRATIRFKDEYEEFFVYRGHDGYPENVEKDLKEVLDSIKNRRSDAEMGSVVSCFIGQTFDLKQRCPSYELTSAFHGDESYRYHVTWDKQNGYTVVVE